MPSDFDKCVKEGGRVRTKKVNKTQYIRICYKGDKSFVSEVKTKKRK